MAFDISRRLLIGAGTLGLGMLAMPARASAALSKGFTHNVASGEPRQNSILLWTRYIPAGGGEAKLECQLSRTSDFAKVIGGQALATPDKDHCAKVTVTGLTPGEWYHYRFVAPDGSMSPVGRTRTLPEGDVASFKLGIFSCSNLPFGWFNAYAHAAARDDLDLMVHLGDYIYEYERGVYPSAADAVAGRLHEPATEMIALADYRQRHANYRADPDLQRLHQLWPMVTMWDDHETTNDPWAGGAQNHQPETEGDWYARKAAAIRAYREWMPVSDNDWESYEIGTLATIFRPETRTRRSQHFSWRQMFEGKEENYKAVIANFRDNIWRDPSRTMMGFEQEKWLADGFAKSAKQGTRWQVLAQQVFVGTARLTPEAYGPITDQNRASVERTTAVLNAGLPIDMDPWDGYPAARARMLRSALDADANLLVLTGDSHNAWAFELDLDGTPAGVEFAGQSVTSNGLEAWVPHMQPADLAPKMVAYNPQLKWAETKSRGYMTVELTPEKATSEWLFLDTIRERSTKIASRHSMITKRGSNKLA